MTRSVLFIAIETNTLFLPVAHCLVCDPFKWRSGGFDYGSVYEIGRWSKETDSRGRLILEVVVFLDESSDVDGFG